MSMELQGFYGHDTENGQVSTLAYIYIYRKREDLSCSIQSVMKLLGVGSNHSETNSIYLFETMYYFFPLKLFIFFFRFIPEMFVSEKIMIHSCFIFGIIVVSLAGYLRIVLFYFRVLYYYCFFLFLYSSISYSVTDLSLLLSSVPLQIALA